LLFDAKYNEPRILARWISADVGKIHIKRNQDPIFLLAHLRNGEIGAAAEILFQHGVGIMASRARISATSIGRFSSILNR
jgi:hypothetical protein